MQSADSNLDPRLANELHNWAAQEKMQNVDRISVQVDRNSFIATRNALTNAFVGLSGAIDEAVKAYVNHTNAVLDGVGGQTLDVGGLLQPIMGMNQLSNVAALAQQAFQSGNGMFPPGVQLNPDGTKKKRQYKPRDPNAPKRPLTAYFRYLQEQRPLIQAELQAQAPNSENGKAGDISKIATERWNALPKDKQIPYRKAYEKEMTKYYDDVKEYKKAGGQVEEDEVDETSAVPATPGPGLVDAEADDSDDTSSTDSDADGASDDESEREPTPPPVVEPPKPVKQKAPKAQKKAKAGADPPPPAQQFSSIMPEPVVPPAPVMASSSPSRKRKSEKEETAESGKKRKKSKAQKEAEDSAAAAAQLVQEQPAVDAGEKTKKEKKKKRKSEVPA